MAFMEFGPAVGAAGAERIEDFSKSLPSSYSRYFDQIQDHSPFDRSAFGSALDRELPPQNENEDNEERSRRSPRPARHQAVRPQPPLSAAKELALICRWQNERDESSRARLLLSLNPLCLKFAAKYRRPEHLGDLYQQAQIGAAEAIDTYVPGHGTRLSSWAWWSIRDKVGKYLKAEDRPARLAKRLGIKMIELDAEIENEDGEGETSMHERVALPDDDVPPDPGEHTRRAAAALATLAPRDRDIVERHIRRQTFAEIGAALNLSGERARQLYKGAIKSMLLAVNGEARGQPRRAALQPADKLRKKIGGVTGGLRHVLLRADVKVSAGKYLKCREVSELRSIDRDLADVVGSVQAGLKGAAFLRWKETRPTVNDVAARAPVASACGECGKAFKAGGRGKFCAAECSLKDLRRVVLRVVFRQLDRRSVSAAAQVTS